MIVDCHTQVWDHACLSPLLSADLHKSAIHGDVAKHLEAVHSVDRAIVLAFKSCYLGAETSNRYVSDYVRRHSSKLVGFAGVDPTDPNWRDELKVAHEELGLKGVTVSPPVQNFHPSDTRAMKLYGECARRGMPVLFEQSHRNALAKLEFARPYLLDEVAREFPDLRMAVAHLGYPWVDETVVLLGKHKNVFANIAGLLRQPWPAYSALMTAYSYGVMDRLLFGSDFPYRSPASCIESLYSVNQIAGGTNLPTIPREQLRGIVERDSLVLLGIERAATPRSAPLAPAIDE
jgi:uncharacterized protein